MTLDFTASTAFLDSAEDGPHIRIVTLCDVCHRLCSFENWPNHLDSDALSASSSGKGEG